MNKYSLLCLGLLVVLVLSGCETIKGGFHGAAEGMKKDFHGTKHVVSGVVAQTPSEIKKIDEWTTKNLW